MEGLGDPIYNTGMKEFKGFVKPGKHVVSIKLDGFHNCQFEVELMRNKYTLIEAKLVGSDIKSDECFVYAAVKNHQRTPFNDITEEFKEIYVQRKQTGYQN